MDASAFWKSSGDATKIFPLCKLLMFIVGGGFSCKLCHNETNLKSGSLPVSAAEVEVVKGKVCKG